MSMTLAEFKNRVIEDGIASVKRREKRLELLKGGLAGFELCRSLETPIAFQDVLAERHKEEARKRREYEKDDYWEYRYATIQVEFVYGLMKVGWSQSGLYQFPSLSARAVLRYAEVVGVT